MNRLFLNYRALCLIPIFLISVAVSVDAQWDRGGRGGGDNRQPDMSGFLSRLDNNRNGFIEPNEMSSRTRSYVSGLGFSPDRPHRISTIIQKVANDKQGELLKQQEQAKKQQLDSYRKVPDFSTPLREQFGVPGFDGEITNLSDQELITKFGASTVNQALASMSKYDRDKNGLLDAEEQQGARWGPPTPQESDKNKDGRLSKYEMIVRYYERDQAAKSAQQSAGAVAARQVISQQNGMTVTLEQPGSPSLNANNPNYSYQQRGYVPPSQRRSSNVRTNSPRNSRTPANTVNPTAPTSTVKSYNSGNDRYERYVKGLMRQYDKNNDGKLDKDELGKMRRPPVGADANKDGFVTVDEYVAQVSSGSTRSSAAAVNKSASSNPKMAEMKIAAAKDREARSQSQSRSRPTSTSTPASFGGLDTNEDGQIQMSEFASDWDQEKVEEFAAKDINGDGLITPTEWSGQND